MRRSLFAVLVLTLTVVVVPSAGASGEFDASSQRRVCSPGSSTRFDPCIEVVMDGLLDPFVPNHHMSVWLQDQTDRCGDQIGLCVWVLWDAAHESKAERIQLGARHLHRQ